MVNSAISKQFTKFILPFQYDNLATDLKSVTVESNKGKQINVFIPTSQESDRLRSGIGEMLASTDDDTSVADIYELNSACRKAFGLTKRPMDKLTFHHRGANDKSYELKLESVKVYLFESGVGLFEIECGYDSCDVEDYIDCNYFISETKSDQNYFEAKTDVFDPQTKTKSYEVSTFTLVELADKVLDYLKTANGARSVVKEKFYGSKALIYSYVYLDKKPEKLESLLFNFRKNFKDSYKYPPKKEFEIDPNIKQQFENSYWGASLNGAVNLSFATGDEETDSFFEENFFTRTRRSYYTLFLHVIHQRYALLRYLSKMGELDKLTMDYEVMKAQLKKANAYKSQAARLKFMAFFSQPSMEEHVNTYYDLLTYTFKIEEIYDNFTKDLNNLEQICQVYVTRIKERDAAIEKRRKIKIEIFVAVFGTLVGIVTLFNDYWNLIEKIFGFKVDFFSIQMLVFAGLLALPLLTSLVDVYYRFKDVKKITDDLNEAVSDGLVEDDKARKKKSAMLRKKNKK